MKTTTMFREAVAQIPNDVRIEVDLSFAIADKIDAILSENNIETISCDMLSKM